MIPAPEQAGEVPTRKEFTLETTELSTRSIWNDLPSKSVPVEHKDEH